MSTKQNLQNQHSCEKKVNQEKSELTLGKPFFILNFFELSYFLAIKKFLISKNKIETEEIMALEENWNNRKNILILENVSKSTYHQIKYSYKKPFKIQFLEIINWLIIFFSKFFKKNPVNSLKLEKVLNIYFTFHPGSKYLITLPFHINAKLILKKVEVHYMYNLINYQEKFTRNKIFAQNKPKH